MLKTCLTRFACIAFCSALLACGSEESTGADPSGSLAPGGKADGFGTTSRESVWGPDASPSLGVVSSNRVALDDVRDALTCSPATAGGLGSPEAPGGAGSEETVRLDLAAIDGDLVPDGFHILHNGVGSTVIVSMGPGACDALDRLSAEGPVAASATIEEHVVLYQFNRVQCQSHLTRYVAVEIPGLPVIETTLIANLGDSEFDVAVPGQCTDYYESGITVTPSEALPYDAPGGAVSGSASEREPVWGPDASPSLGVVSSNSVTVDDASAGLSCSPATSGGLGSPQAPGGTGSAEMVRLDLAVLGADVAPDGFHILHNGVGSTITAAMGSGACDALDRLREGGAVPATVTVEDHVVLYQFNRVQCQSHLTKYVVVEIEGLPAIETTLIANFGDSEFDTSLPGQCVDYYETEVGVTPSDALPYDV